MTRRGHMIPDKALDWWARGFTVTELVRMMPDDRGRRFTREGFEQAIRFARNRGDPRAVRRRKSPNRQQEG